MFWNLRIRPGEDERKVYAEAEEYGIICKAQDLQGIAERLDKYIKKTKVRGAGLAKYIGRSHLIDGGEIVYTGSDDARNKREAFFQGLFDCIGFPVEALYTYPKDSSTIFSK